MFVTFTCTAHADITMFGDVATQLIKVMGHSGTLPSALLAEEVPAALERLKTVAAAEGPALEPRESTNGDDEEPAISLRHHAGPLLELLGAATTAKCNVMWHRG